MTKTVTVIAKESVTRSARDAACSLCQVDASLDLIPSWVV